MAYAALALFIGLPLVELYLIIKVGQTIGAIPTILALVAMGFLGLALLRRQGLKAIRSELAKVETDDHPLPTLLDAMGLLLAGFLLLFPGFLTDVLGLLLFIPKLRRLIVDWLYRRLLRDDTVRFEVIRGRAGRSRQAHPAPGPGPVIEGEFTRVEEHTVRSRRVEPDA